MTVLSCPKCGILKQGVPEDLDEFAEEIAENKKAKNSLEEAKRIFFEGKNRCKT